MKVADSTYVRWEHRDAKETICVVEHNGAEFKASAKAGHGDEFRKAVGRRIALSSAISGLTKPERTMIWTSLRAKKVSFA